MPRNDEHDIYEGTFRWPASTVFDPLPAFPAQCPVLNSFEVYLTMRGKVPAATPQMLDALSFPLSLACGMKKLGVHTWAAETIHIVVAGASIKTEQRILHETNYWEELGLLLPQKQWVLHFVGPDVRGVERKQEVFCVCASCGKHAGKNTLPRCTSCKRSAYCSTACQKAHWKVHKKECKQQNVVRLLPNLTAVCAQKGLCEHLSAEGLTTENTVIYGCNTGCGSGNLELMRSWASELHGLVTARYLCIMSCANTWGDLRGELLLLETSLRAKVVMAPSRNPFKGTVVAQSERVESSGLRKWFCANYCLYAFQGAQSEVPPLDVVKEHVTTLADVINKFEVVPEEP